MLMNDLAEYGLVGLGFIGILVGLFFLYIVICVIMGLAVEMVLGWMGKEIEGWYWTGVGLVALLGTVVGTSVVAKSD